MNRLATIILLLTIAGAADAASFRGDHRDAVSPPLHRLPASQCIQFVHMCPTAGTCVYIGESSSNDTDLVAGADSAHPDTCEWDGQSAHEGDPDWIDTPSQDTDLALHPGWDITHGIRPYSMQSTINLHNTGLWTPDWDGANSPSTPVSFIIAHSKMTAEFSVVSGRTYQVWLSAMGDADVTAPIVTLTCPGQSALVVDDPEDPIPYYVSTGTGSCTLDQQLDCIQNAYTGGMRSAGCHLESGVFDAPTPTVDPPPGCGIGPELALLVPLLRRLRR